MDMSRYVSPQRARSTDERPLHQWTLALAMRDRALILPALLLAAFAINLDTTIVNVALPSLVRELHASNTQLQWIVDAYNLVFAALLLASGSLSDRVGRKGMLLAGLGVFGGASLVGGLMSTPGQLIVARCVMGLGAAMIFPATLSLISNVFTERAERAKAIGLWGATAGAAVALGRSPAAGCSSISPGPASSSRWRRSPPRQRPWSRGWCRPHAIRRRRGSTGAGSCSRRRRWHC
jgi:MFS family permease